MGPTTDITTWAVRATRCRSYSLTEWIDNPGSTYHGGQTTWQWLIGQSLDPSLFRDYTLDHEINDATSSHLARHNIGAASFAACGDLNAALERLVFDDAVSLASAVSGAVALSKTAILYSSGHMFVYGHQSSPNPVATWWNIPGYKSGFLDIHDGSNGGFSPPLSSYCDVSGL